MFVKKIDRRVEKETMPFDKAFITESGNEELCHATGDMIHFEGDEAGLWWNEYEDRDGNLYYGR